MRKTTRLILYSTSVLLVFALALTLRTKAADRLPIDFDEDDYLRAGQEYTALIRAADWGGFLQTNYRAEHPPLAKIIIGLSLLSAEEESLTPEASTSAPPNENLPRPLVKSGRMVNAVIGAVTVLMVALLNPFAGMMLALHTFTIKYVSQIMLEALPALTSLITALSYLHWKKRKNSAWLILSAFALGLTAASKYLYCVVGVAVLLDACLDAKEKNALKQVITAMFLWGIFAVAIFFLFNPYLWTNPIARLQESIFYHSGYTSGAEEVKRAGYPLWQPLAWLFLSPYWWHEHVFPFPFDPFIALLAFFGVGRLWKKERLYVLWMGVALLFLLAWNTKWPQYIITLTVPLTFSAAEGLQVLRDSLLEWRQARKKRVKAHYERRELRRALPWLIPGLIAFALLTLFPLIFQLGVSLISLNGFTLRDGFQGGIWRELWGGLSGQIRADSFMEDNKVHFGGLRWYGDVFNWVGVMGLPFFNTLWAFLSVTLQTLLGVGAALLLWQRGIKFRKGWQVLFILPWAIPEAIGAMLWLNIFAPISGMVTLALNKFGTDNILGVFQNWEQSQNMTLVVLLLAALWYGFPFMMLAAGAGLKLLPQEVFDAAAIDGADAWQTFRYVTMPLLAPLVIPAVIIRAIFAFNQFYLFQMFYFVNHDFNMFTFARLSYFLVYDWKEFTGSAIINIITLFMLAVFILIFNRWSKAGEGVNYA